MHFVNLRSIVKQANSGIGAVDVQSLVYHCSVSVIVPGGAVKGPAGYRPCFTAAWTFK